MQTMCYCELGRLEVHGMPNATRSTNANDNKSNAQNQWIHSKIDGSIDPFVFNQRNMADKQFNFYGNMKSSAKQIYAPTIIKL